MGDSQQPKPAAPRFEVPDLELEPMPRSKRGATAAPSRASAPKVPGREHGAPNLFDDDAFGTDSPRIYLDLGGEQSGALHFGAGKSFAALSEVELEVSAASGSSIDAEAAPHSARLAKAEPRRETTAPWPSGPTPERERLAIDARELSLLANYGEPPKSAHLTPLYAYRVFTRQREIKRALVPLEAERLRAEAERESSLAELAHAVRPDTERSGQFQRLLAPLIELEQVQSQRGQALSMVNAELSALASALDTELMRFAEQVSAEQTRERDAQRRYDEQQAGAQRAEAKLKRVQIEIRAVTRVAEQKLGPKAGAAPEPEATQLAALMQRSAALEPEVNRAKVQLQQARVGLDQAAARVGAARQSERLAGRKKQALVVRYQQELELRGQGLNESEQKQRAALADLGRAVLAACGSLPIPEPLLERVRSASQRADALLYQCELQVRASAAYDHARVAQGVRLACTFAALFVALIVLKLAL